MKKKFALTAVIIFVLASAGYSTYAYMTASKTAQNIITAGTVEIELNDGFEEPSEESGGLYTLSEKIRVMPSSDVERTLSVTNIGKNACYVRVKFLTEFKSAYEGHPTLPSVGFVTLSLNNKDWIFDEDSGYWYYKTPLQSGITTENLLELIHFEEKMGNEYQNATFNLSVSAQAVQAANNSYTSPGSVKNVKGWPDPPVPSPSNAG